MARPPRIDTPGVPLHIVQRGVDRRPCFVLEVHYREYLRHLREQAEKFGCHVHAYVLMCNHVHLLATPQDRGGAGRLMQELGRRYVAYFNFTMGRTGTLWEGRFKSCVVDQDSYLLRCYRYIELNPVRAGIVGDPANFRWSSYHSNALATPDALITPHPAYQSLGSTPAERALAYRAIVDAGSRGEDVEEIRAMTSRQRAFGSREFKEALAAAHGRPMGFVNRGRPRAES